METITNQSYTNLESMKVSVSAISCSWVATITFMAGFLVFIARPWSGVSDSGGPQLAGPVAEGLSGVRPGVRPGDGPLRRALASPPLSGRRKDKLRKKEKKGKKEKEGDKEKRMKRRRKKMLAEQREYRQWRRDVMEGRLPEEEEDTFEAVLDELLNELF